MNFSSNALSRNGSIFVTILVLLFLNSGCAGLKNAFNFTSLDEEGNEIARDLGGVPANTLLTQGMDDYSIGKYFTAVEFFEEIMNRYPFSPEATLAELKAADCKYHLGRYQEALLLYEEFENRHPTNEGIPYVIYQKAMCNYKRVDRIDRDTSGAVKAIELFQQLLRVYPDSPYVKDAGEKIAEATEFLADHEFFVAEYYVRADKLDQARVRLQYLLAAYPMAKVAPQANELLDSIKNQEQQPSRLTSWLPDWNFSSWTIFGDGTTED
jgi:outer membrane protein assembly factor BamD